MSAEGARKDQEEAGKDAMFWGGKQYGRRCEWTVTAVICLAMLFVAASQATPQQGRFPSPPSNIHGQAGSVLEVPTAPASQIGKDTSTIPQLAPQQGQELELPSRALRGQSGYEQLTVTVTDQGGRYVTGLQRGDFRIYVDGIQRPLEFLRRDTNTPVSIGILVDTSGSMEPKSRRLARRSRSSSAISIRMTTFFCLPSPISNFYCSPLPRIMNW